MRRFSLASITILAFGLAVGVTTAFSASKMPASRAGTIDPPTGKIAFVRDKDVWVMEANGTAQTHIADLENVDGKLSWSPDNSKILITRSGKLDVRGPDGLGGMHKLYDLFVVYPDSAKKGNKFFWHRITEDFGSRDGEWLSDGRIIYYKDMNANQANALMPNYQIAFMDADGSRQEVLRKDWQNMTEYFVSPSASKTGDVAFVHMYDPAGKLSIKPQGIAVLHKDKFMAKIDSVRAKSSKMKGFTGPSWSPDGKWLAFVSNEMSSPGLFLATPDLKERFLVYSPPVGLTVATTAPSWSPNSKWLTFAVSDGSIWICDITGNGAKRLTAPGTDSYPAWSKGTSGTASK